MRALRLVRAIVDTLKDITALESLITRYQEIDSSYVVPIAKSLDMPQLVVLNYELTLSVAFYLRGREIAESQALSRTKDLVRKAKENGDEWIVIYDNKTEHNGYTFFRRLEMHIPDGVSLHFASELDLEKGKIFSVEPMLLDSKTGRIKKDSDSLGPRQEFLTKKNLMSEVIQLRKKYSQ
jgi:hypothetical protein|tara:strand:- start:100 stop:639 length:540 start_codon:yes stop_codon:yes gene_type:complete